MIKARKTSRSASNVASVSPGHERTNSEDAGDTLCLEVTVVALIPEFHQAKVRDDDGHLYALTHKTKGVDLAALQVGQRVVCTVTRKLPRVLTAAAVEQGPPPLHGRCV